MAIPLEYIGKERPLKISDKFTNSGYDNLIRICSRIFGDDKGTFIKKSPT